MIVNLNQYLNPYHVGLFQSTDRELLIRGGANAGKSYSIADKLLLQSIVQSETPLKVLVIKSTQPSLRDTVIDILQKRASLFNLPLEVNFQNLTARCKNTTFLFRSMFNQEDYKKVKSYTDIDYIWINEIIDIREQDYRMLKSRLRGGEAIFSQIISDFNPTGKTSWVFQRFYEKNIGKARKLLYTVLDNPWAKKEEIEDLRNSKYDDPNYYKIYFLGEWGELEGVIYNWDIVSKPPDNPDEILYGGDFGYSVDPAALVRIYRKANEFWVEQVIYETELTNVQLGHKMKRRGVCSTDVTYWDCAEPKSIQELYDMDFNAKPCEKGPDSVRAGIDFLKEQTIHIIDGSEDIVKEQKAYVWKEDKDGKALNIPIDFDNHAMDAIRYGIYTHCKIKLGAFEISKVGVSDIWT